MLSSALQVVFTRPVHYPQHPWILDYADRHGVLLVPEIPMWQFSEAQMKDPRVRILVPGELVEDDRAIAAVKAALCMLSRRGNPDHSAALVPKGLSDRETEEPTLPAREPMKVGSRV